MRKSTLQSNTQGHLSRLVLRNLNFPAVHATWVGYGCGSGKREDGEEVAGELRVASTVRLLRATRLWITVRMRALSTRELGPAGMQHRPAVLEIEALAPKRF